MTKDKNHHKNVSYDDDDDDDDDDNIIIIKYKNIIYFVLFSALSYM